MRRPFAIAATAAAVLAFRPHQWAPDATQAEPAVEGAIDLESNPPAGTSKVPSYAEWKEAKRVRLLRSLPRGCKASLKREWIRLHCEGQVEGVAHLAGATDDVFFTTVPPNYEDWQNPYRGSVILIFPVRRGQRRLFQIVGDEWGHNTGALTVSSQWLDGQAGPWVSLVSDFRYFLGGD